MKRFVATMLACYAGTVFAGGLEWANTEAEFKVKPGDTSASVQFHFVNKGKVPVKILRIRTTCGCTAAASSKQVYEPGEQGVVTATFLFEGRTGKQGSTVRVVTDDPKEPVTALHLTGMLPWNVQLSERLLVWDLGGEPAPKEVLVEMHEGVEISLAKVEMNNDSFACSFAPTEVPRQYRLVFTPASTAKPTRGIASLVTKPKLNDAESSRSRIFLYVK